MKVYIAAPWGNKAEAREIAAHLQSLGHTITSTWFESGEDYHSGSQALLEAQRDIQEIRSADALIAYVPENDTSLGGREFEMGFAYYLKFPLILIGRRKCVFHWLSDIHHFSSIADWKEASDALYS